MVGVATDRTAVSEMTAEYSIVTGFLQIERP